MATSWFNYNSGPICDPLSYSIISGNPNCPAPKERLCAIFAEVQLIGGIERPIITSSLCTQIIATAFTLIETPNVRLKQN